MTLPVEPISLDPIGSDPVVAKLRDEADASVGGGTLPMLIGGVGSLVLIWICVVVMWLLVGLPGLGFKGWFLVLVLLYGGAAFAWLRMRPKYLVAGAFEYVDPRQEWLGIGRYGPLTPLGGAADVAFIGPRMAWAGFQQRLRREPPSRERFYDRCALLLRQLGRAGEAVKLESLEISEDETGPKLRPVLDYLDRHGWIGLNSDGTRVWLSSRAKNDLLHLGIVAATAGA